MRKIVAAIAPLFFVLVPSRTVYAQASLSLSSTPAISGSSVTLNLSLAVPSGTSIAGLEWTLTYPSAISNVTVTAGAALTNSGKTVNCATTSAGYTCVATGINQYAIASGVVASVSATVSGSGSMGLSNVIAADPNGNSASITSPLQSTGLTVPTTTISSLTCGTTPLAPNATSSCTVTLSAASGSGGTSVTIGTTGSISAPTPVTVPSGSSSTTFTATAGSFSTDQTATVTASLNSSSKSATISLSAPVLISALSCNASSLASNASTTCTVTSTKAAPTGGASVTISGGVTGVFTLPASVTIAAGSTTATFTAAAGTIASNQTATVTASLNGSSKSATISLSAPVLISSVACGLTSLTSNASTTCTVTLTKPAPTPGGATVQISGAISNVLTLPTSTTVAAGSLTGTFVATTLTVTAPQTVFITTTYGSSSAKTNISLVAGSATAPTLTSLTCSPASITPGQSGTCTASLSSNATALTTLTLRSSSSALSVPSTVSIAAGKSSGTFGFTTTSNVAGWLIIVATMGSVSKSATLVLAAAAPTTSSAMVLSCPRIAIGGDSVVCTINLSHRAARPVIVHLSTSSPDVLLPSTVTVRSGELSARFRGTIASSASQNLATVSAVSQSDTAQASVAVEAMAAPILTITGSPAGTPGSEIHLSVSATSTDELPIVLSASRLPEGASFEPASGDFRWTPATSDAGNYRLTFTATKAAGVSSLKSIDLHVGGGAPELIALANAAGPEAPAACSPGSIALLNGYFLADSAASQHSGGAPPSHTRVLVNGLDVQVISAAPGQVEFLCPADAPGSALAIVVRKGTASSTSLQTVMQASAPGILSLQNLRSGEAGVLHSESSEVAGLPNPYYSASPATGGESLTILASGIDCRNNYSGHIQIELDGRILPVENISPSARRPGACELTFEAPATLANGDLMLHLQTINDGGAVVTSNSVPVSIE